MKLLEMMISQFGVKECQLARTNEDISRLCQQFDPEMISGYFRRKHLVGVGKYKISPDIVYPTEPWIDDKGNIIGIIISEERQELKDLRIISERHEDKKWKFMFDDILDVRLGTDIHQFLCTK